MKCGNSSCDKEGTSRCAACKSVYYCSQPCQKQAWKAHKPDCKHLQSRSHELLSSFSTFTKKERRHAKDFHNSLPVGATNNIPEVHLEYWARYKDDATHIKLLEQHFYTKNSVDMHDFLGEGYMEKMLKVYGSKQEVLRKRWGGVSEMLYFFLNQGAKPGDIFFDPTSGDQETNEQSVKHSNQTYSLMRNIAVRSMTTYVGKTYVSIGFVDLHQIMFSDISDPESEGNVNWHCYDANEVVFARATIILELFKASICCEEDILQIWYSSSIERPAQVALQTICKELATKDSYTVRIKSLFSFWGSTGLSTKDAREEWAKFLQFYAMDSIYALESVVDRVDYARYLLTGEIFLGPTSKRTVGNVTVFCMPKGFAHFDRDSENIFYTLALNEIKYEGSLVNTVKKLFVAHARKLRSFVQNGKTTIKLYHKAIRLREVDTLRQINALKPAMINWSNLPDCMIQTNFFAIAMTCSGIDTQHQFHLCNWIMKTHGCTLIDYLQFDLKGSINDDLPFSDPTGVLEKLYTSIRREFQSKIIKEVEDEFESFKILKQHQLNPLNASIAVLSPKMLPHFKKFFFCDPQFSGFKVKELEMEQYSPFSRAFAGSCGVFKFTPECHIAAHLPKQI